LNASCGRDVVDDIVADVDFHDQHLSISFAHPARVRTQEARVTRALVRCLRAHSDATRTRTLLRALRDYLEEVGAPLPRLNPNFGAGALPDVDQDGLNDDW
jgi:hypothetical protein